MPEGFAASAIEMPFVIYLHEYDTYDDIRTEYQRHCHMALHILSTLLLHIQRHLFLLLFWLSPLMFSLYSLPVSADAADAAFRRRLLAAELIPLMPTLLSSLLASWLFVAGYCRCFRLRYFIYFTPSLMMLLVFAVDRGCRFIAAASFRALDSWMLPLRHADSRHYADSRQIITSAFAAEAEHFACLSLLVFADADCADYAEIAFAIAAALSPLPYAATC